MTAEFRHQLEVTREILVPGRRRLEVARVRQAVGADRPQVRQPQGRAEILAKIATRRAIRQLDPETQPARNDHNLLRLDLDQTQFGSHAQPSLLRDDEQLGIRVVEKTIRHGAIGDVPVDGASRLRLGRAVTTDGTHACDEIGWLLGNRQGTPAQRIR